MQVFKPEMLEKCIPTPEQVAQYVEYGEKQVYKEGKNIVTAYHLDGCTYIADVRPTDL